MEPDAKFARGGELLTPLELVRLARVCVGLGIEKVRITGGEPTVHPHLKEIIKGVAALGVQDVAMTTNGALASQEACEQWRAAGLTRLTFSLDSVREDRFTRITRSTSSAAAVIAGMRAALAAGLGPIKSNAVIVRGFNEDEVVALAGLARELAIEVRFIEYMPLDAGRAWEPSKLVPAEEMIAAISAVYPLVPEGRDTDHSTSLNFRFADGAPGRIGVIAPVTRPFCGACSRLRITADGKVRPCLFSLQEWDIRPLLRGGASDEEVEEFLIDVTWTKQAGHGITAPGFTQPERTMSAIGG